MKLTKEMCYLIITTSKIIFFFSNVLTQKAPFTRRHWTNQQVGSMWVTMHKPMFEHHVSKSFTNLQKIKSHP